MSTSKQDNSHTQAMPCPRHDRYTQRIFLHARCSPSLLLPSRLVCFSPVPLPIALGDTLQLVLLLDGVRVRAPLGGVDQLLGQALGHGLDVPEGGLAGADGQQRNGLVDTAQRRHVDGLATYGTGAANAGRVLAGAAVDDGVDGNLDGVLVGHDVDLRERFC